MSDGLLENIINLEKKIQFEVAAEQARAQKWQERELVSLKNALAESRESELARLNMRLNKEKVALQLESKELEAAASEWCRRLSSLEDTVLRSV